MQLTIGAIARRSGVPTSTLRYYEAIGVLPPPQRRNGRRVYDAAILPRLTLIAFAQRAGLTLNEIRAVFSDLEANPASRVAWQELARRKLADLAEQQAHIQTMRTLLNATLDCACATLADCAQSATLF